jgi:hypothetical protein
VKESHSGAGDASDKNAGVSGMRPLSVLGRLTHKLSEEEDLDLNVVRKNQPVLMSVYKNPDTDEENFVVVVKLHGCVSDVEFSLVGISVSGSNIAKFSYSCPFIAFDIPAIFKKEIETKEISSYHPLILSHKNQLKFHFDSIDKFPVIFLPQIEVHRISYYIKQFEILKKYIFPNNPGFP